MYCDCVGGGRLEESRINGPNTINNFVCLEGGGQMSTYYRLHVL